MKELNGATHKDAKRAKKEGFGADILYDSELPPDISKKKLTMFCIFLGLVGGHCYYAGKIIRAIFSTVSFITFLDNGPYLSYHINCIHIYIQLYTAAAKNGRGGRIYLSVAKGMT